MDDRRYHEYLAAQILSEEIEEEVVDILRDLILEEGDRESSIGDETSSKDRFLVPIRNAIEDITEQIVYEELYRIAGECFDDILLSHSRSTSEIVSLNKILYQVTKQMTEEIILEVLDENIIFLNAVNVRDEIINDLLADEIKRICSSVLDHYHMRAGISRFKHVQSSASGVIMDKIVLNSLLMQSESESKTENFLDDVALEFLSEMMLDVLLSQSIALHACCPNISSSVTKPIKRQQNMIPMDWFKKKFLTDVVMNVALDMLTEKIDNEVESSNKKKSNPLTS